jgi:F-type H+-transporting ATPase subunit b
MNLMKSAAIRPFSLLRPYSTQARKDPAAVAESIIQKFPGESIAAKASSALITGSVAAWLISNEIYILDGEVFEMACFFGAYAIFRTIL